MSVSAIQPEATVAPRAPAPQPPAHALATFAEALHGARQPTREEQAREAAENLVSSALVLPILAMVRENSRLEEPFAPGPAERRFGPMLDQQVADRIVRKANFPLVDRLADQLLTGDGEDS
ncbi:MAG: hypothetical protein GY715_14370 [Planctomycetes bacterium]|nr:hypothetical protein [Planctomycetota bacterium]